MVLPSPAAASAASCASLGAERVATVRLRAHEELVRHAGAAAQIRVVRQDRAGRVGREVLEAVDLLLEAGGCGVGRRPRRASVTGAERAAVADVDVAGGAELGRVQDAVEGVEAQLRARGARLRALGRGAGDVAALVTGVAELDVV